MKILLFVDKLYGGGAERVASILLNHLSERHQLSAVVFNDERPTFPIKQTIKTQKITIDGGIRFLHPIERLIKIHKAITRNKPDLVISFMVNLNMYVLLANVLSRTKTIVSEHIAMQTEQSLSKKITRHILYRFASMVTFVSKSDFEYAKWINKKALIYNPLSYPITPYFHKEKYIIAIGPQKRWQAKGFDMLIQMWSKIAPSHPEWKLQFVGANNSNYISHLVETYGLEKRVDFLGWTNEIDKVLRSKSIYILSSRREGFPCSLIEAMSQGCACLAFDCKTGPNEIITNGKSGLLARNGDIDDLAKKLQLLIEDENIRLNLSAGAVEEVKRFEKSVILQHWDKLIEEVTRKSK